LQAEILLFFEIFALLEKSVLHLNMTGFLKVVQRSHTSGSLIPHMWDQGAKKMFFSNQIFIHFLKLNPADIFVRG